MKKLLIKIFQKKICTKINNIINFFLSYGGLPLSFSLSPPTKEASHVIPARILKQQWCGPRVTWWTGAFAALARRLVCGGEGLGDSVRIKCGGWGPWGRRSGLTTSVQLESAVERSQWRLQCNESKTPSRWEIY